MTAKYRHEASAVAVPKIQPSGVLCVYLNGHRAGQRTERKMTEEGGAISTPGNVQ
jgi:hypothetical protein